MGPEPDADRGRDRRRSPVEAALRRVRLLTAVLVAVRLDRRAR